MRMVVFVQDMSLQINRWCDSIYKDSGNLKLKNKLFYTIQIRNVKSKNTPI